MDLTQIRWMLLDMLYAQHGANKDDMVDSIMAAIKLLIDQEIKSKQPDIRKFRNLPDRDIVLTPQFWDLLKGGDLGDTRMHLRMTNNYNNGSVCSMLGLAEARILVDALYPTV